MFFYTQQVAGATRSFYGLLGEQIVSAYPLQANHVAAAE
jgi:hypothetical protein